MNTCANEDDTTECGVELFVVTRASHYWILAACMLPLLAWGISRAELLLSRQRLASLALAYSCLGIVPFASYVASGGVSWTGLELSQVQKAMINNRHAVLTFLWFVMSLVQLVSFKMGAQKVHNFLGAATMYFLLPLIFVELGTNAIFVFLPDKPVLLAQATLAVETQATTWHDFVACSIALTDGLSTAPLMIMYWFHSVQSLKGGSSRNITLHVYFMTCFICMMMSAGIVRQIARQVFASSQCPEFGSRPLAMAIQAVSFNLNSLENALFFSVLFATLPKKVRAREASVRICYYIHVSKSTLACVGAWYISLPFALKCQ